MVKNMKIYYDPEGDILETRFCAGEPDHRTGISLTDQITLFCDASIERPLGFIVLSYLKLLSLSGQHAEGLKDMPITTRDKIKKLLEQSPLKNFFELQGNLIYLKDLKLSRSLQAA
jgi:hypothetical protein